MFDCNTWSSCGQHTVNHHQVVATVLQAVPGLRDDALLERYAYKALRMDVHAPLGAIALASTDTTTAAAAWVEQRSGEGQVLTGDAALDADIRCVECNVLCTLGKCCWLCFLTVIVDRPR